MSDWRNLSLAAGRSLIEASAGTGKTWTIAVLYLRLILEGAQPLRATQIIVSTFTDAAAGELRERLRSRLLQAEQLAQRFEQTALLATAADEPLHEWLQARWQEQGSSGDLQRLRVALIELDQAPILTLHGLCRRILSDFPFDCGGSLQLDQLVDSAALNRQLADDCWRWLMHSDDNPATALVREAEPDFTRAKLKAWLSSYLQPGVDVSMEDTASVDWDAYSARLPLLRKLSRDRTRITGNSKFVRAVNDAIDVIEARSLSSMSDAVSRNIADGSIDKGIYSPYLQATDICEALQLIQQLAEQAGSHSNDSSTRGAAIAAVLSYARARRMALLAASQQHTFDELISRVHEALHRQSTMLADRLFEAWPVAMIDEFQDTDSQQYAIFERIYSDRAGQSRGRLLMIGDPKQAIYRFRGSDIHAYQRAAATAQQRLVLNTNYRSSWHYVQALNQWFSLVGSGLSGGEHSDIHVQPAIAAQATDPAQLLDAAELRQRPLQIHCLRVDGEKPAAEALQNEALQVCADQIAATLSNASLQVPESPHSEVMRPLGPGDIAVLLPSHVDISRLRRLLDQRGVPCVSLARDSVLRSDLARDLLLLLHAIVDCDSQRPLRAAFLAPLWGGTVSELRRRGDDVHAWSEMAELFREWRQCWQRYGVLDVVLRIAAHRAPKLRSDEDAERALTDLRHLGELLQARALQLSGPEELLSWLAAQHRGEADSGLDAEKEDRLRIESDARRVRLLTLHASKGLEFPLLWLPLMFKRGRNASSTSLVSDRDSGTRRPALDVLQKKQVAREEQDERFRLFYVAMTRAQYACHLMLVPPQHAQGKDTGRAPLALMLDRLAQQHPGEGLLASLQQQTTNIAWHDEVCAQQLVRYQADHLAARPLMPARHPPPRSAPRFLHSFSSLVRLGRSISTQLESAAEDEGLQDLPPALAEPLRVGHPQLLALSGLRGAAFGNAVHAIYEQREVGVPLSRQLDLVQCSLQRERVLRSEDPQHQQLVSVLAQRLQAALDAPLGLAQAPGLCLGDLPERELLVEMGFSFAVNQVTLNALAAACARHGETQLVPQRPLTMNGLLTGKIDLIFHHQGRFHVLDYKSNHLGEQPEDYAADALTEAMDHHHYRFQALLYTLATRRYLQRRLGSGAASQVGECLYLFVRAAGLGPDLGIWRHQFDEALLADANQALATGGTQP